MDLKNILTNVTKTIKLNSPEILTALGISGLVTTSYLTAKASYRASEIIRTEEGASGAHLDRTERVKERTKLVWKLYIPPAIAGGITIACIVGASRANGNRTAAAITAYSLTEKAFGEYREKVVEQVGKGKEQKIRDELAQDRVNRIPPPSGMVMVGDGHVLCHEKYTGRYFMSKMELLKKALNDINFQINNQANVTLSELYDILGLDHTSDSDYKGWDSDRLLDLEFSTVISPDEKPAIVFDYNYVKPLF